MSFQCTFDDLSLCLFNSTCTADDDGTRGCECTEWTQHDLTFGHYYNCGLPNTWYMINFIVHLCLYLVVSAKLYFEVPRLKSAAKQISQLYVAIATSLFAVVCAQWAQAGMFEAGWLFFAISLFLCSLIVYKIIISVLSPLYVVARRFELLSFHTQIIMAIQIVLGGGGFITCLALLFYCRVNPPDVHNMLANSLLLIICVNFWFAGGTIVLHATRLKRVTESLNFTGQYRTQDFVGQLVMLRRQWILMLVTGTTVLPGAAIPFWVLGSVPFAFVFYLVMSATVFASTTLLLDFLRHKGSVVTTPPTTLSSRRLE